MTTVGQSQANPLCWAKGPYRLRFILGEFRLSSVTFRSFKLMTHFSRINVDPEQIILSIGNLEQDVDLVFLSSVPVRKTYPKLSKADTGFLYVTAQFPRYYVVLSGTFDDYLNQFSSKTRSTLRRKVRKFKEFSGGTIDWREYRTPGELQDEFYPRALELSRRTYQHRLLEAGLPDSRDFIDTMKALASEDRVRAYLLFHGGNPVAYLYCPSDDGVLEYAYLGYEPELSEWSCGTVLQFLAFERIFGERKFKLFDFTQGEGEHKRLFGTSMTRCADLMYFRLNLRNLAIVGGHYFLSTASNGIVTLLDSLRLKRRIKRLFRASVGHERV